MKYVFGLVGILVTLGVIVVMMSVWVLPMVKTGTRDGLQPAAQIAGYEGFNDKRPAADAVQTQPEDRNGKFIGLRVMSVVPGSTLERHFGVMVDDVIIEVGGTPLSFNADEGLARAMFEEAYQRRQELTVVRGGQKFTLPSAAARLAAPAAGAPGTPVPTPTPAPAPGGDEAGLESDPAEADAGEAAPQQPKRRNVYDQVDAIRQGVSGQEETGE